MLVFLKARIKKHFVNFFDASGWVGSKTDDQLSISHGLGV